MEAARIAPISCALCRSAEFETRAATAALSEFDRSRLVRTTKALPTRCGVVDQTSRAPTLARGIGDTRRVGHIKDQQPGIAADLSGGAPSARCPAAPFRIRWHPGPAGRRQGPSPR